MATERSWPFDFETDGVTPQETTQDDGTKLWQMHAAAQGAPDGVFDVGVYQPLSAAQSLDGSARVGSQPVRLAVNRDAGNDRTVLVNDGLALVRGIAYELTGGNKTISFAANVSGSDRYDRIVLQLDPAAWKIRLVVKQGTPGGTVPALTQTPGGTWEIPIRTVRIRNGVGVLDGADLVSDDRYFLKYRAAHGQWAGDDPHSNTNGAWTGMSGGQVEFPFFVPPSGTLLVSLGAREQLTAAGTGAYLGFQIRSGSTSGTVVVNANTSQAVRWGSDTADVSRSGGPFLLTGLPPGLYVAQLMQHTSGTGTWRNAYLTVVPVP